MMRKRWVCRVASFVAPALLAASAALTPSLAAADGADAGACGTSDSPCPLQKWMRSNMGAPLAAGDMDALGRAMTHVASSSPDPTWTTWAQVANQGAAAAAAKDIVGVKASCKACHDAFKDKYKAQYRSKAFN